MAALCENISIAPSIKSTITMGVIHHFFRVIRNCFSSPNSDISSPLYSFGISNILQGQTSKLNGTSLAFFELKKKRIGSSADILNNL